MVKSKKIECLRKPLASLRTFWQEALEVAFRPDAQRLEIINYSVPEHASGHGFDLKPVTLVAASTSSGYRYAVGSIRTPPKSSTWRSRQSGRDGSAEEVRHRKEDIDAKLSKVASEISSFITIYGYEHCCS